ncbi:hypothetical protein Tco_0713730 [Tanacetum coccineum]
MHTKTELTLEQTQQGVSDEVLVSIEGVEELKRNVNIKGEKMKPSLHLGRNRVNTHAIRNTKLLSGIEDSHHGPNDAMHNPSQPLKVSQKTLVSFLTEIKHISVDSLTPKHQSDTKVFTMTMEILPEPTSNKLYGRANPQATTFSEEQLVPHVNRLAIKKNNQRVASDSDIIDTMLRFIVGMPQTINT